MWPDLQATVTRSRGDSIVFSLACAVSEGSPGALSLEVRMRTPDDDLAVPFRLNKTGDALVLKLIPEKTEIPDAGFSLNSATLRLTPLAGVLDILWTQNVIESAALGGESPGLCDGAWQIFPQPPRLRRHDKRAADDGQGSQGHRQVAVPLPA